MPTGWRIETDMSGWMRSMEKRLLGVERRPVVQGPKDILGPGIAPFAAEISDWDSDDAAFNGFFYGVIGANGAPDPNHGFLGQTVAMANGYGIQRLYAAHDATGALSTGSGFIRRFFVPGAHTPRIYATWEGL